MEGRGRERYLDWRHRIGCFEKKETPVSRNVKEKSLILPIRGVSVLNGKLK